MTAALTIDNLSAGYGGRQVLRELSLPPIASGRITALVGPNGAGKTTLLRALAGLVPASGAARFGDIDLLRASAAERARVMAFMPQFLPQRLALGVLESVISALRVSPPDDIPQGPDGFRDAALAALDSLGIAHLALQPFDQLSGGQRQLASLAQALVRRPQLLLLDEPTSALDLRHQLQVMEIVRNCAVAGSTVVAVLHDLQAAARWADVMVVMKGGTVHATGAPEHAVTASTIRDVYGVDCTIRRVGRTEIHIGSMMLSTRK